LQQNKEFKEAFDNIVCFIALSMGFAALKIISQLFYRLYRSMLRAFTAVSTNTAFVIIIGWFMGKVKL
jgi:RsiW-degrading membrane proteinase PrsW (M82 family)